MKAWFDDPQQLVRADQVTQFWPNRDQTPAERINTASRFIIYATCIIYLTRRDPRIFVLGGTVLSVLYVMYKSKMIKEPYDINGKNGCQLPTENNPMANVLITDYTDAPNRLEACYYPTVKPIVNSYVGDQIQYDGGRSGSATVSARRNLFERQFVSAAVSKIPGDQTSFAEWCYGKKNGPICRTHPEMCDPNARGAQLEAFGGVGYDGDKRSGMHGGTVR